ncbi:hypothetical protein Tco_0966458 [Tanacetum coccineum]
MNGGYPIIEEYESNSDDEYVIQPSKEQEKPSFAFINTVKHVKTPRETIKEQNTYSLSPKADKRDWNGLMSKRLGLGYKFTKRHVLYVAVLVILLEIVIFMRKEWLNRPFTITTTLKAKFSNQKVNTARDKAVSDVGGIGKTAIKALAVHHVSTENGQDIFMLVEKYYPLTKGLTTLMLSNKLRVDQQSEMADEILTKIYNIANKPKK